jgi:hypothetical protein
MVMKSRLLNYRFRMVDQSGSTPLKGAAREPCAHAGSSPENSPRTKGSVRTTLQQRYEVSRETAKESVKIIQKEGLVVTIQGGATNVATGASGRRGRGTLDGRGRRRGAA